MPQVGAAYPRASPGAGAIKASESRQRPAVRVPGGDGAAVSVSGRFPAGACRTICPAGGSGRGPGFAPRPPPAAAARSLPTATAVLPFRDPSAGITSFSATEWVPGWAPLRMGSRRDRFCGQMLTAGFPAAHALRTLNSILALRGSAGAVTVDLAELYLDTGPRHVIQVGRRPQLAASPGQRGKNRDSHPTAGISVTESRETVEKLSLRRGKRWYCSATAWMERGFPAGLT